MTEWTWAKVEAAAAATAGWRRTRRGEWRGPCRCGGEVNRAWVRRGRRANVLAKLTSAGLPLADAQKLVGFTA